MVVWKKIKRRRYRKLYLVKESQKNVPYVRPHSLEEVYYVEDEEVRGRGTSGRRRDTWKRCYVLWSLEDEEAKEHSLRNLSSSPALSWSVPVGPGRGRLLRTTAESRNTSLLREFCWIFSRQRIFSCPLVLAISKKQRGPAFLRRRRRMIQNQIHRGFDGS